MYVPLGLLERKQQQRRDESVPKDDVYQLDPQVIVKEYENQQFLTEVIQGGNDQRLAIIGEPGAGKTTLLDKIASWIDDSNLGLPICIPLGGLQGETLAGYLLKIWLKQAAKIEANQENLAASLEQQFRSGKVWLLLDAVDEMAAASPAEALAKIRDELVGWVAEARVVLTCRLNVWDASVNNALPGFETYRTLEFKPEQVDEFIGEWFAKAEPPQPPLLRGEKVEHSLLTGEKVEHSLLTGEKTVPPLNKGGLGGVKRAEKLLAKLKEPNRANIYNLVRSPLRLALLCQTFYLSPDEELPETQAMLYERFIRYFYEWKQEQHSTTRAQRQQLNQVLGELAKAGIESESRFRLRESWAIQLMGESGFELGCQLGWLNLVDRDAKTDEAVYAFFHPTFQEYFAAKAIEDWHFFLHHVPDNPKLGIYRIFERRWKEVMLLWVGRDNVLFEQKEGFIKALIEFDDGFNREFYWYRSVFVAAVLIAEFKDCSLADAIVADIIKWRFGYFNTEKQQWRKFPDPIAEGAREVLQETEREKIIAALVELIRISQSEDTHNKAAYSLGEIDKDNGVAIATLVELIRTSQSGSIRSQAIHSLGKIGKDNPLAIAGLVNLIDTSQSEHTQITVAERMIVAESLGKIDKGNRVAIEYLVNIIKSSTSEYSQLPAVESLGKIGKDNQVAIKALEALICTSQNEFTRWRGAENLEKIDKGNSRAIEALVKLVLHTCQDEYTLFPAAESLGKFEKYKTEVIEALEALIDTSKSEDTRKHGAESLGKIDKDNRVAITTLVELIRNFKNESIQRQAAESLGKIGKDNQVVIKALEALIPTFKNEYTRLRAAESLGKIDKNNSVAILSLVELSHNSHPEYIHMQAAECLGEIDKDKSVAITTLVDLIRNSQDKYTRRRAAYSLGEFLTESQETEEIKKVVTTLKYYLLDETYNNDSDRFEDCYKVLWHCAQNLPYPTFYEAWHYPPTTPNTITLNWQTFPQDIARAINKDSNLSHHLKPISIDINKFLDPDNPAAKIYSEMLLQGCPKSQDSKPKTLAELQTYWDELRIESDIFPLLIFYDSQTGTENATAFSNTFLKALSKFDGFICAVCDAADISLPTFSPSQPNLIANMVGWMREKMMES